jgi:hypothetical protein
VAVLSWWWVWVLCRGGDVVLAGGGEWCWRGVFARGVVLVGVRWFVFGSGGVGLRWWFG